MTFDKSKVYTALNAEELEVGSEVILANYLQLLKQQVESNSWPTYVKRLDGVMGTSSTNRFKSGKAQYNLAYLVRKVGEVKPEKEQWIVYLARYRIESSLCCCVESCWENAKKFDGAKTKLFVGSEDEAKEWCNSRRKFVEVIKDWENGKQIQFRKRGATSWTYLDTPKWYTDCEYRVKPGEDLYVVFVDHYDGPYLDFGLCAQWDKIQEYKGANNKLFIGREEECKEWCDKRDKFAETIFAWDSGAEIQFYSVIEKRWVTLNNPSWDCNWEYRVKPNGLVWTDLEIGNVLWREREMPIPLGGRDEYVHVEERRMVTGIVDDSVTNCHIQLGDKWINDEDLKKWIVAKC